LIVLDASATLEWLLQTPRGVRVGSRIFSARENLHAPHLIDVELAQALRRFVAVHSLSVSRAEEALQNLSDLRVRRYRTPLFFGEFGRRNNLTSYDALYVALAEALDAPLLTCDAKLAAAPGHRAVVEVI